MKKIQKKHKNFINFDYFFRKFASRNKKFSVTKDFMTVTRLEIFRKK